VALVVVAAHAGLPSLPAAILGLALRGPARLRVVALAPRRPLDWTALALGDGTALDGLCWTGAAAACGAELDDAGPEAQAFAALLVDLNVAGVVVEGWVSPAGTIAGAVRDGARGLGPCRAVTVLCGPGRLRPPRPLVRFALRQALGPLGPLGLPTIEVRSLP
jgi:hypothetical protein